MQPKTVKRTKTPEQALNALMRLAARAERSSGDALRLMRNWGINAPEQRKILDRLIKMRFIDDGRYAEAFIRDKMRFSGWGAYKIRAALRAKGIAADIVDNALAQLDGQEMGSRLATALEKKIRTTKYTSVYELKTKLMRYGLSLGYDYDTVADAVGRTLKNDDSCTDF